jgi:hypothetical protein
LKIPNTIKGWRKFFQANEPYKQAGEAILISDKVDFKLKSVRGDNKGHFILIKGTIHQEEISILNIYAPNTGVPIYILKKSLIGQRAQTDSNTVTVGELINKLQSYSTH